MRPALIKTAGYLVSSGSVALLGIAAYPGAAKAGLVPALWAGMALSIAGMALRWISYEVEQRRKTTTAPETSCERPGSAAQLRQATGEPRRNPRVKDRPPEPSSAAAGKDPGELTQGGPSGTARRTRR